MAEIPIAVHILIGLCLATIPMAVWVICVFYATRGSSKITKFE